jgi:hypothetical protein
VTIAAMNGRCVGAKGSTSMVATEKTIEVVPGSELDRLLEAAADAPLILVKSGRRFRLAPEGAQEDIWANYDPERVRRALRESAGALAHIDVEAFKADLRAQRGQDSHGRPGD